MPSRKQRRREAKTKRHEYEFVYLDSEGHELEEPPEEATERPKPRAASTNGSKPSGGKQSSRPARRPRREPQPPSWQRAGKRALLLGVIVFVIFSIQAKSHGGYGRPALVAFIYTGLFVPLTYLVDRFAYRRYEARKESGGTGLPQRPKKR